MKVWLGLTVNPSLLFDAGEINVPLRSLSKKSKGAQQSNLLS
jgi:hypothetical protein